MKNLLKLIILVFALSACSSSSESEPEEVIVLPSATCNDGCQNGDETGVDCGGSCKVCPEVTPDIPTSGYDAPSTYVGYNLVWSDEFNIDNLDTIKWNFHLANGCPNLCGWGNNELQYYTDKNHSFVEGNLIIKEKRENIRGFKYSSTRINTDNKFEFKYGRIDIRANMPSAVGA